jgi:hypothetical protein
LAPVVVPTAAKSSGKAAAKPTKGNKPGKGKKG